MCWRTFNCECHCKIVWVWNNITNNFYLQSGGETLRVGMILCFNEIYVTVWECKRCMQQQMWGVNGWIWGIAWMWGTWCLTWILIAGSEQGGLGLREGGEHDMYGRRCGVQRGLSIRWGRRWDQQGGEGRNTPVWTLPYWNRLRVAVLLDICMHQGQSKWILASYSSFYASILLILLFWFISMSLHFSYIFLYFIFLYSRIIRDAALYICFR